MPSSFLRPLLPSGCYAMQAIFTKFSASLFQDFLSMIEDTEFLCVLSDSSERKELNGSKNN